MTHAKTPEKTNVPVAWTDWQNAISAKVAKQCFAPTAQVRKTLTVHPVKEAAVVLNVPRNAPDAKAPAISIIAATHAAEEASP